MNKIIVGLVILAIGMWAAVTWWWFLLDILKGLAAIILVLGGLTLIALGLKSSTKTAA